MPSMTSAVDVNAPLEVVWDIVSDIDNEPEYWHGTREVKNTRREGMVTERVVVQNFMGTKVGQRVTLEPPRSVLVEYLRGTTVGTKRIAVESVSVERQHVRVDWDIRFTGILWLITPVIRDHVLKGTVNALQRVKDVSEGRTPRPGGGEMTSDAITSGAR